MTTSRKLHMWASLVLMTLLAGCLGASQSFEDDFSDPASGWGAASHETYVRGYQQGRYLFQIDVPQWYVWATSGRSFEDVELSAVVRAAGQTDNHYGLVCRYDEEQFYYFAISADGYYGIFRMDEDGELLPLTGTAMFRSAAIHTDGTDNRLTASCRETELSFFVNGALIAEVQDDVLAQGDVGMATGTVSAGGTSVWFDDFEAQRP
ncbi:MAG: hypothetical protein JXC32_15745 [Anaerolineae bacterium]|nr:hypothetical protein [Anaerolineae bacterium]